MKDHAGAEIVVGCRVAEADFSFGDGVVESIVVPCVGGGFNVGVKWDQPELGGPPWSAEGGGRAAQHPCNSPRRDPPRRDPPRRDPPRHDPPPRDLPPRDSAPEESPPGSVRLIRKQLRGLRAAQGVERTAAREQQIGELEFELEERERKYRKNGHW